MAPQQQSQYGPGYEPQGTMYGNQMKDTHSNNGNWNQQQSRSMGESPMNCAQPTGASPPPYKRDPGYEKQEWAQPGAAQGYYSQ